MTVEQLNIASRAGFAEALAGIYENSPWVPARAAGLRPFADLGALKAGLAGVVAACGRDEQLGLVRAHPDLAGRLARAGALAAASAGEQEGLGLDRLSDAEFTRFDTLNTAYRTRFGFPFVIAVKRQTRESVLAAFEVRLGHDAAAELRTALAEIDAIAGLRLDALLGAPG